MTGKPLFLDTTILVDRVLGEHQPDIAHRTQLLLSSYDFFGACSYSRLEYKRVVIQHLALILNYLVEEGSYLRAFERATKQRSDRKKSTLGNLAAWVGHEINGSIEVQTGEDFDQELAVRSESYLRNAILSLWRRFERMVTHIFDGTQCTRATEAPRRLSTGRIDAAIPESACKQKTCNNANFFRKHRATLEKLCTDLENAKRSGEELSKELEDSLKTIRLYLRSAENLYNYKNCLDVGGDVWIHLECLESKIKNFGTTNSKESKLICQSMGLEMKGPPKHAQ